MCAHTYIQMRARACVWCVACVRVRVRVRVCLSMWLHTIACVCLCAWYANNVSHLWHRLSGDVCVCVCVCDGNRQNRLPSPHSLNQADGLSKRRKVKVSMREALVLSSGQKLCHSGDPPSS